MAPEPPIGRTSPPTDRTKPYSRGTPTACHVYLRGPPSPSTQPADTKVWPSRCFTLNSWHREAILGPIYHQRQVTHQRAPALSLGVLLPGQATVAGPEGGTAPWCSGPDSETTAGASSICAPPRLLLDTHSASPFPGPAPAGKELMGPAGPGKCHWRGQSHWPCSTCPDKQLAVWKNFSLQRSGSCMHPWPKLQHLSVSMKGKPVLLRIYRVERVHFEPGLWPRGVLLGSTS